MKNNQTEKKKIVLKVFVFSRFRTSNLSLRTFHADRMTDAAFVAYDQPFQNISETF